MYLMLASNEHSTEMYLMLASNEHSTEMYLMLASNEHSTEMYLMLIGGFTANPHRKGQFEPSCQGGGESAPMSEDGQPQRKTIYTKQLHAKQ